MQSDDTEEQRVPQSIPGPLQLPPLIKGQKIKQGPYDLTVTDEMVAQRERENLELYKAWIQEQRRRNMLPQEETEFIGDFKNIIVRRSFVRKVFCLLTLQLIFTILVICIFIFVDEAQKFMLIHWYMWIIALMVFIFAYSIVVCSMFFRRTPPYNYICLFLLTLAMSYLAAFVSVFYNVQEVLIVMVMTTIVTMLIVLIATFSRFDLTMRPGLLIVIGLVSIVTIFATLIILLVTQIMILRLVIASVGTLMLSMYLYFDVQTIMGGRRIELSPEEVVFATMQIYVDIVLLYQYLLMFMGFFRQ